MQPKPIPPKLESKYTLPQLFPNLKPFLSTSPPFSPSPLEQNWHQTVMQALEQYQVLVVGAGGLGCEIVKNLALSGIRKIHLVDMDTIDLTNLNRQFLFRKQDVNKNKAEVVARFVMRRCPGVEVIPYVCRVQELDYGFYNKFGIVIGGLDNIEARKYLNNMVHQLNEQAEDTVCFYIDGATEGFLGQCLVVQPFKTSCYNCSLLDGLGDQPKANYCTIANTPRTPEHCIQYVLQLEWQNHYPHTKRDNDNLQHMKWVYQRALQRAKKFNIQGVTEMLTLGLAKNIIPAIASTNALIASFCTNQAMKLITASNPRLNNYFLYKGATSTGSETYLYAKKQNCNSCNMRINKVKPLSIEVQSTATVGDLIEKIHKQNSLVSKSPFININEKLFYNPSDRERRQIKIKKTMKELRQQKIFKTNPQEIIVTDISLKSQQRVYVKVLEESTENQNQSEKKQTQRNSDSSQKNEQNQKTQEKQGNKNGQKKQ